MALVELGVSRDAEPTPVETFPDALQVLKSIAAALAGSAIAQLPIVPAIEITTAVRENNELMKLLRVE
jgi:hypothetical protein